MTQFIHFYALLAITSVVEVGAIDIDKDADRSVDVDMDVNGDAEIDRDADGDVNVDMDVDGAVDVDMDVDGDADIDRDADGNADVTDRDTDGDADVDRDADGDADVDVDEDVDADVVGEIDTEVDREIDADSENDVDGDKDGETDILSFFVMLQTWSSVSFLLTVGYNTLSSSNSFTYTRRLRDLHTLLRLLPHLLLQSRIHTLSKKHTFFITNRGRRMVMPPPSLSAVRRTDNEAHSVSLQKDRVTGRLTSTNVPCILTALTWVYRNQ